MTEAFSPRILLFFQGTVEDGAAFFGRLWPGARAVSDSNKRFYDAFGIQRGGLRKVLGPEVWAGGVRAALKGNGVGVPVGDPWMMPGVFLVKHDTILWEHEFRHAGDHPKFTRIAEVVCERISSKNRSVDS